MRVLVTGGAGFIGRALIPRLLEAGHEVTVIDAVTENVHGPAPQLRTFLTEDCSFTRADIRDPSVWPSVLDPAPDVVVHLAAETGVGQSMYEIGRYTGVNIQGTAVLLDALREHTHRVGRIVLASSRAVYGEGSYHCASCGTVTPSARSADRLEQGLWDPVCPSCGGEVESIATKESAPRAPTSVYAMTKTAQEDLVTIAGPTLGASTAILRYANVYGEGQPLTNPYTGVLSAFALRLVRGELPRVYEDGLPTRDFVHVDDVAAATARAVMGQTSVVANIGSGERWSLMQIAGELTRTFGLDPDGVTVTGQYRVGDIRAFLADVSAARSMLGYAPAISLADGLARLGSWVRDEAEVPSEDVASRAEADLRTRGLLGEVLS